MRGVDLEVDGLPIYAFVAPSYPRGLVLNLAFYIAKIVEPPIGNVMELGPFRPSCRAGRSVGIEMRVWDGIVVRDVDQLKNEWPSGNDATTAREEIPADNILKDR
jgi:hypothetical protein